MAPGAAITDPKSLAEASDLIRQLTGITELDYEAAKAAKRNGRPQHAVTIDDLQAIYHTPTTPPNAEPTTSACAAYPNSSAQPPSTPTPFSEASSRPCDQHATHHRSTAPLSTLALNSQGGGFAAAPLLRVSSLRCGPLRRGHSAGSSMESPVRKRGRRTHGSMPAHQSEACTRGETERCASRPGRA